MLTIVTLLAHAGLCEERKILRDADVLLRPAVCHETSRFPPFSSEAIRSLNALALTPSVQALQSSYELNPIAANNADHNMRGRTPIKRPGTPSFLSTSLKALTRPVPGLMAPVAKRVLITSIGVVHALAKEPARAPAATYSGGESSLPGEE